MTYEPRTYWHRRAYRQGPSYVGPGGRERNSNQEAEEIGEALAARLMERRPIARLLDFGCGSGRLSGVLAEHAKKYVGVDISGPGIAQAEWRWPSLRFMHLPDDTLPFADGSFDVAAASLVFQHIPGPDAEAWAKEIVRVLAPDGAVLVVDHRREPGVDYQDHMHPREPGTLARMFGRRVEQTRDLATGHWMTWMVAG